MSKNALKKIRLTCYNVTSLPNLPLGIALAQLGILAVRNKLFQVLTQGVPLNLQLVILFDALAEILLEEGGSISGSLTCLLLLCKECGGLLSPFLGEPSFFTGGLGLLLGHPKLHL